MFKYFAITGLICFSGLISVVQAASTHTVAPLAFNLNVEKRDIIQDEITLVNLTDRQLRLYPTVNEVAVDGNGVVESFQEPSTVDRSTSPTTWVEISRARIELTPGETRKVPFTIRMNPNTAPGEYSIFIGFGNGSNQPEAQAAVTAGQAPGTLVNLTVDKKQDQFLRIERFTVDRFLTGKKPGEAFITLHNPSAVDIVPGGELIIYDSRGTEIASVPANSDGVAIARERSETYHITLPNGLAAGKYKAYLAIEYGENHTESVQDNTYFYVIPFQQLIIAFIVVLLSAVGIALYIHRRFDVAPNDYGAEPVAMYLRGDRSQDKANDINVSRSTAAPISDGERDLL